ncbi:MAG: S1 RNA-binding domain-containing protein [Chloroflexota bacterium]
MDQPELGNEEDVQETPSSAELSESETAATPETPETSVDGVGDAPTEIEEPEATTDSNSDAGGDTNAAEPDTDDTDDSDDDEDEEAVEEANGLRRGQVILGTVARTTPNELFVNLGEGREGVVPKREVELMSGRMLEKMQEGAEIHVYIVNPSNHRGVTILSINHAQEELDWRKAEEYMQSKDVYDGKIGGYNKGGLIVRFGRLRGFVPQSQISDKRMLDIDGETPEERFSGMVNKQISVKVMEVDRSRNRLILSERAAMREVRQRRKETLITELQEGEIRDGRVVSLENFGAFVDIGGAEGLVHITELSYQHVTHPKQVLEVGQEVEVKVINIDEQKNRIGLSIKQLQADPWDELATRFGTGALIRAEVTKLTKFGAFAKVIALPAVEGLIHISELSDDRVEHPRDVVNRGDKLTLRVVKIDVRQRRLGLSLRRVNSAEFLDEDLKRAYRELEEREDEAPSASGDGDDDTYFEDESEEEGIVEEVVDEVEEVVEEIAEEAEEIAEEVEEAVEEVAEEIEETIEEVTDAIEETIDGDDDDESEDTDDDESDEDD